MPRYDTLSSNAKKRILNNVRDRLSVEVPQEPQKPAAPQKATAPRQNQKKSSNTKPKKSDSLASMAAAKLILLALVVIAGVAVIFWLRDLGEAFGINWIGD